MGRQSFDAAIDTAKAGNRRLPSFEGGPDMAAKALEEQGVNVKQLVAGKGQGNLGSAEEEPVEDRDAQSPLRKSGLEKTAKEKFKAGGKVGSASKRADGIAMRGKTRGMMR